MHSRSLASIALALTLGLAASTVSAQDTMDFEVDDIDPVDSGVGPGGEEAPKTSPAIGNDEDSLKTIYGSDNLFGTKLRLERHMGLYLLRFPQRDQNERVEINGKDIEAKVWVSIGSQQEDEMACKAVEWMVFGRTRWALGARGVFSDFPDIRKLTIHFINVRKRDGERARADKKVIKFMTVSLTRSRFNKIKMADVRESIKDGKCSEVAKTVLSSYRFDRNYYDAYQDDR